MSIIFKKYESLHCIPVTYNITCQLWASQVALGVKSLPASAGDIRDAGLIPGSGRSPGGEHGNPLQYSWLETPMDRGDWWDTVHRVAKSWTWLKWLSTVHVNYIFQIKKEKNLWMNGNIYSWWVWIATTTLENNLVLSCKIHPFFFSVIQYFFYSVYIIDKPLHIRIRTQTKMFIAAQIMGAKN